MLRPPSPRSGFRILNFGFPTHPLAYPSPSPSPSSCPRPKIRICDSRSWFLDARLELPLRMSSRPKERSDTPPQNVIPTEKAEQLPNLSSRPRERSDFPICHPDRESGATSQSVIPTEKAERLPILSSRPRERSERVEGSMGSGYWKLDIEARRASRLTAATQTRSQPNQAFFDSPGTENHRTRDFSQRRPTTLSTRQQFVASAQPPSSNPHGPNNHLHPPQTHWGGWAGIPNS